MQYSHEITLLPKGNIVIIIIIIIIIIITLQPLYNKEN